MPRSSNTSAYRLKRINPEFAAEWDDALSRAGEGLVALAYARAVHGRETIIYRNGEEYERRVQPDSALLALLIKRGDMAGGAGAFAHKDLAEIPREEILTRAEWKQHIRFSPYGGKYLGTDPVEKQRKYDEAIARLRARLKSRPRRGYSACAATSHCRRIGRHSHFRSCSCWVWWTCRRRPRAVTGLSWAGVSAAALRGRSLCGNGGSS